MSAAARLAREWWEQEFGPDFPTGTEHDRDDMLMAFTAGFEACAGAGWFGADVPFLHGELQSRPSKAEK